MPTQMLNPSEKIDTERMYLTDDYVDKVDVLDS